MFSTSELNLLINRRGNCYLHDYDKFFFQSNSTNERERNDFIFETYLHIVLSFRFELIYPIDECL